MNYKQVIIEVVEMFTWLPIVEIYRLILSTFGWSWSLSHIIDGETNLLVVVQNE